MMYAMKKGNNNQGRGKRLGTQKWLAIRTAFVIDGLTYEECSKRWDVSVRTIAGRSIKEGWVDERKRRVKQAQDKIVDEMQSAVDHNVDNHNIASNKLLAALGALADEFVKAVESEDYEKVKKLRGAIEAGRSLSEMGDKVIRSGRLVLGIKEGEPSTLSEPDTVLEVIQQRLEPKVVETDKDGRAIGDEG